MIKDTYQIIHEMYQRGNPFAVATVVETTGSSSAKISSKAVIDQAGRVVAGWVGGGCAESGTCAQALECMKSGEAAILDIDLDDEVLGAGMPCGGSMRVYIEPIIQKPTLWIMGHGRVAESLCVMAELMSLKTVVNDPILEPEKYPPNTTLITDDLNYSQLKPLECDYVVIATQHKGDHESMQIALKSKASYIALIASRKRARLVLDYLQEQGFAPQEIAERVLAPAGLDLGARTPEEIALCVLSEITLRRRGGSGLPMAKMG